MNATEPTVADRLARLREEFPPHQISKLPKPYKSDSPKGRCQECGGYHGLPAVHLDYVGHAALTDRLLDVDPLWSWEPVTFSPEGLPAFDKTGGLWIRLTVCGVTRLGYGNAPGKTGGDAVKEIIGDALRNAAMRFGAALDLWHKGDLHAEEDEATATSEKPKAQEAVKPVQVAAATRIADGLADRTNKLEATLLATTDNKTLDRMWALGSGLCGELSLKDPERLVELEAVYEKQGIFLLDAVRA